MAVKDDVTESCETQCTEKLEKMKEENANVEGGKGKEIYDTCLAKCVSEEAKDIVEERAKVRCSALSKKSKGQKQFLGKSLPLRRPQSSRRRNLSKFRFLDMGHKSCRWIFSP